MRPASGTLGLLPADTLWPSGDDQRRSAFLIVISEFIGELLEVLCRGRGIEGPRRYIRTGRSVIVGVENSSAVKRVAYRAAMRVGQAYRRSCWNGGRSVVLGTFYGLARLLTLIAC